MLTHLVFTDIAAHLQLTHFVFTDIAAHLRLTHSVSPTSPCICGPPILSLTTSPRICGTPFRLYDHLHLFVSTSTHLSHRHRCTFAARPLRLHDVTAYLRLTHFVSTTTLTHFVSPTLPCTCGSPIVSPTPRICGSFYLVFTTSPPITVLLLSTFRASLAREGVSDYS